MASDGFPDRRKVLQATGAIVFTALAGCGDDGEEEGVGEPEDGEGDDEPAVGNETPEEGGEDNETGAGEENETGGNETSGGADEEELEEWFADTDNYDGVEDHTGEDEVTVDVGAGDDGLLFDPPAIEVDAGTTVVWEWTGEGGTHNVAEENGEFESDLQEEEGATFEYAFEDEGTYRYVCQPHSEQGMRGAVVAGGGGGGESGNTEEEENSS